MLFYYGTNTEVRLGDRVLLRRLFRRPVAGKVIYMPGSSPPHPEMEWPEFSRWAIELQDGTVMAWPYLPAQLQPDKRIVFVDRGTSEQLALQPTEELK